MLDELPNLRHLRAFCEVERLHSIRRAAEVVFLSQPAVTQAIANMESAFGVRLFDRIDKGVVPTSLARAYANRVRRALAMIESGAQDAARLAGKRGSGALPSVLPSLTTTQLRAFVAVGATSNFTLAARMIGSSQPSVHRTLKELQAVLGFSLLERTTRGIALTLAGQGLWKQVRLAFAELEQGRQELQISDGGSGATIVIGCLPLARQFVMPETTIEFCTQHPDVQIKFIESPYVDLLHALRHGEIDFVIGALRDPPPVNDISQESLFGSYLCVAGRTGHPLAGRERVTIEDLMQYPWVLPGPGTPTREVFDTLLAPQGLRCERGLIESSSQILVRGLLMGSDRLTLISTEQVQFEIDLGLLCKLNFVVGDPVRRIGITTRTDWHPSAVQLAFCEKLRAVAARY